MDILKQILATKHREVAAAQRESSFDKLHAAALRVERPCRSLRAALLASPSGIIAEFKRKSPSKGFIHAGADAARVTAEYAAQGAAALSVLTDREYFGGSPDDLQAARQAVDIPILRKDFIVDPYQLCEARLWGADAVLLIAAALTPAEVRELALAAHELELEVLLELHDASELGHICPEIDVVGVNNRNLSTFVTDVQVSLDLAEHLPADCVRISESGLSRPETLHTLRKAGYRGFLMGENFMKETDPAAALGQFIAAL